MPDQPANSAFFWRVAGGDHSRRGLFGGAVQLEPRPSGRLSTEGAVQASTVFDEESRAFVADMAGHVQAFSRARQRLWQTRLSGGISASPAVSSAKPLVFVGTHLGSVYALDTGTGQVQWRKEIPTKSDPRILSDLLYLPQANVVVLSSWGGRFLALDAESGAERFSWDAGISPSGAAAADTEGNLYCLRAVTGKGVELVRVTSDGAESLLHRLPEGKRGARRIVTTAAPVLDPERGVAYFVVNQDQGSLLMAWSQSSGSLLWSHSLPSSVQATPALRKEGTILLADLSGALHAIGTDGGVLFRYSPGCDYFLAGPVCDADGHCFLGDPLGVLHVIEPTGAGRPMFEAKRSIQSRASFAPDGSLFVPASDRTVYILSAKPVSG